MKRGLLNNSSLAEVIEDRQLALADAIADGRIVDHEEPHYSGRRLALSLSRANDELDEARAAMQQPCCVGTLRREALERYLRAVAGVRG